MVNVSFSSNKHKLFVLIITELFCTTDNKCLNGATCQNGATMAICICVDGYTGEYCETGGFNFMYLFNSIFAVLHHAMKLFKVCTFLL